VIVKHHHRATLIKVTDIGWLLAICEQTITSVCHALLSDTVTLKILAPKILALKILALNMLNRWMADHSATINFQLF